jgi:hypothetical protein
MQPDGNAALAFLRVIRPEGPWLLNTIDASGITGRTFEASEADHLVEWVEAENRAEKNMYFSVNPTLRKLDKKASREDIAYVEWLMVDIDPDYTAGETVEAAQTRGIQVLNEEREGLPKPTLVVNSGGGIQAYWRLKDPIHVGGDLGRAEDAKRHNSRLEQVLGGDHCSSIDHIMRLPGTVNWPDERKRKRGRVPAMSAMLDHEPKRVYDITRIPPLIPVQMEGTAISTVTPLVKISGNIQPLKDIDDLNQWDVPDRLKVIALHGRHPNETKEGDNSRSAWVFDFTCGLARAGVPDDVIYSILLDKDYLISESILDKRSPGDYAKRQLQRALEWTVDPNLEEMNGKHAVIEMCGGKVVVIEESYDETRERTAIYQQSPGMISERYRNRFVQVGTDKEDNPKYKKLGNWWLDHRNRRQFHKMAYIPGENQVKNVFNLWRGWNVEARPGSCSLFLMHLFRNVCSANQSHYDYLMNWMARAIQVPKRPGETAIVLRGDQGTGKSFFANSFGHLFGRHYLTVSSAKHLVGNFNAHMRDLSLLFADEAFFAGDKAHEGVLKTLVTGQSLTVEMKGYDLEEVPNRLHLIMASNSDWVVPAGGNERRFLVLDVGDDQRQNAKYFRAIQQELDDGGYEALLHQLMTRDITLFDVRNVPQTQALKDQKVLSQTPMQQWWYSKLLDGRIFQHHADWETVVEARLVFEDYSKGASMAGVSRRGSNTAFGVFLSGILREGKKDSELAKVQRQRSVALDGEDAEIKKGQRANYYIFPPLGRCRVLWCKKHGDMDWPDPLPFDTTEADEENVF